MKFWRNILQYLKQGERISLMYVIYSHGSSPGRTGFKMAISESGFMSGSIGGGFMEHKLVELSKNLLSKSGFAPFSKLQIHKADIPKDRSGMICSGEQRITFYHLDANDIEAIKQILDADNQTVLNLTEEGIRIVKNAYQKDKYELKNHSDHKWNYRELIKKKAHLYIIGGGHVSLALSELMSKLDFKIIVIDNRQALNTMNENQFADKKIVTDYNSIKDHISNDSENYIVAMSFGYKTDKLIISKLLDSHYIYFGIMGSKAKMQRLLGELEDEGCGVEKLQKLHTPIGLLINSRTPMEIAVSIAAEIINLRNSDNIF